ncbi:hypothetical protein CONLIGDRAFT_623286 [Coniochaeta ligniaria NRRL 30616]|uniref:Glycosyl transferase n=1 Tax=Coniochaeta ligniaria NRRL 30616 TaxID=1408157 RepID=A0A1J7J5L2_9PEZI|nr:hypothetical protein CONLIGDRAFT_623286 [Coniochaeta ligniaria NRRL 30616]
MVARNVFRLSIVISACLLLIVTFPYLRYYGDYVRQTNPFSGQKDIELAFIPTESELACLNGIYDAKVTRPSDGQATEPIPNIVHFIFGLKNPLYHADAGHFDFLSYLAVRSALVSLYPEQLFIHYTYLAEPPSEDANADPLTNPWIRRLMRHSSVKLVHHKPDVSDTQYAHLSDTMRLEFLLEQGGIYLDIDAFALRPFDDIRTAPHPRDIVLGHEGGNRWGLCNAVIAARPNSTFVSRWLDSYSTVDFTHEWNYHSVLLPKEMADRYPEELCALAPDAFFWPTWTWRHVEWMHQPLSREEARYWQKEIEANSGSLFKNQLAYHSWNQMSYDRHLKGLTPDAVRTKDTRFNLLVRRFVEDDL